MEELANVRANQQGKTSEAEKIYGDETFRSYFLKIQELKRERDIAIAKAIQDTKDLFAEKIRKVEAEHGFLLVLTKD